MAGGWPPLCHHISKMHSVGEGPGETPSPLRCISYLINSLLTDIKQLLKLVRWPLFLPPSDEYVGSFVYLFYTLIKLYYQKSSEWSSLIIGPRLNSSLGKQDQTIQSQKKSTLNTLWKDWCWNWSFSTLATWFEQAPLWKDPDVGKDWSQNEKRETEDEMVGWYHWFSGHEFEQTLGDCEGQRSLACCSP